MFATIALNITTIFLTFIAVISLLGSCIASSKEDTLGSTEQMLTEIFFLLLAILTRVWKW